MFPLLAEMAIGQLFCGGEEVDEDVVGGDVGSDKEIQYAFLLSLLQLQNEPLFVLHTQKLLMLNLYHDPSKIRKKYAMKNVSKHDCIA